MRQADGLETRIGEHGRSLSAGERQRLAIARALLKKPPVLVLDEATSALDAGTEGKVKRALDEAMRGRTTFIIAHRLARVRSATRILVFDHGRIVETGTFDELCARGGRSPSSRGPSSWCPGRRARRPEAATAAFPRPSQQTGLTPDEPTYPRREGTRLTNGEVAS